MERFWLIFLFTLLLASCADERESLPFPRIVTDDKINVTTDAARVHFSVEFAQNGTVIEYGAEYQLQPNGPVFEVVYVPEDNSNVFTVLIQKNLLEGKEYGVRVFARTKDYKVYGDQLSFISNGGIAPVIKDIFPREVSLHDTITVRGANFSELGKGVKVGGVPVTSFYTYNDTLIRFLMPKVTKAMNNAVRVASAGKEAESEQLISLKLPEIAPSDNYIVLPNEMLSLRGQNLEMVNGVYLGSQFYQITLATDTLLQFKIATTEQEGVRDLILQQLDRQVVIPVKAKVVFPKVESILPLNYWKGTVLTLRGSYVDRISNFKMRPKTYGGVSVSSGLVVLSKTDSLVQLKVVEPIGSGTVSGNFLGKEYDSGIRVQMNFPKINSISQNVAFGGDKVQIEGERFFTGMISSIGKFSNITETTAILELNTELNHSPGIVNVNTGFWYEMVPSDVSIRIPKLKIVDYNPKTIKRGDTVSVELEYAPQNLPPYGGVHVGTRDGGYYSLQGNIAKTRVALSYEMPSSPGLTLLLNGARAEIPGAFTLVEQWEKVAGSVLAGRACLEAGGEQYSFKFNFNARSVVLARLNVETGQWVQVATKLHDTYYIPSVTGCFAVAGDLYVLLGAGSERWGYKYSLETGLWKAIAPFPAGPNDFQNLFAFSNGTRAFVGNLTSLFEYIAVENRWVQRKAVPTLLASTFRFVAASSNGRGYLLFPKQSGMDDSEYWSYDFANDSWTSLGKSPNSVYSAGGALVYNQKLYIGGMGYVPIPKLTEIDLNTGKCRFFQIPPLEVYNFVHLFVKGGYLYFGNVSDSGEYFAFRVALSDLDKIEFD